MLQELYFLSTNGNLPQTTTTWTDAKFLAPCPEARWCVQRRLLALSWGLETWWWWWWWWRWWRWWWCWWWWWWWLWTQMKEMMMTYTIVIEMMIIIEMMRRMKRMIRFTTILMLIMGLIFNPNPHKSRWIDYGISTPATQHSICSNKYQTIRLMGAVLCLTTAYIYIGCSYIASNPLDVSCELVVGDTFDGRHPKKNTGWMFLKPL